MLFVFFILILYLSRLISDQLVGTYCVYYSVWSDTYFIQKTGPFQALCTLSSALLTFLFAAFFAFLLIESIHCFTYTSNILTTSAFISKKTHVLAAGFGRIFLVVYSVLWATSHVDVGQSLPDNWFSLLLGIGLGSWVVKSSARDIRSWFSQVP